MTDQQFNKLMNVLAAQMVLMQGIFECLQAMNVKSGGHAGTYNFKEAQTILDNAAHLKIPG